MPEVSLLKSDFCFIPGAEMLFCRVKIHCEDTLPRKKTFSFRRRSYYKNQTPLIIV